MSTYHSTGTICCKIKNDKFHVHFVPDNEHFVKHLGKKYAVFIGKASKKNHGIVKHIKKNHYSIKLDAINFEKKKVLSKFAARQSKVDVEVDDKFNLIGITVPAQSDK